jgi:hypothetical protein
MASVAHANDLAEQIDIKAKRILEELLDSGRSTVSIEREYEFNRGLIPFVLEGGHSPTVLEALGLPVYERREVVVCAECGEIHTMHKTCGGKRRVQVRYRKSADMESNAQKRALDEVARENGFRNRDGSGSFTKMCRFMASEWMAGRMVIVDSD